MPRRAKTKEPAKLRTYGKSRAVRLPGCDYASDVIVHLTICAEQGQPFQDSQFAPIVADSVERSCELCGYKLFGFCLMPDHLHVLLSPANSGRPVADYLYRFKSFTTSRFLGLGGQAPLWQRSAYDHVCRSDETAEGVLTYIVNNPVRAGLVKCWQDWPWTKVFIEM